MSIQYKIENINGISRAIEMALLLGAGSTAFILIVETGNILYSFLVLIGYVPLSIKLQTLLRKWRHKKTLEIYRFVVEPIFEVQLNENDKYVHQRSEKHKAYLIESGNELFKEGLISVEKVYFRDAKSGHYREDWEQYEVRKDEYINDYMTDWAKTISLKHENFVEKFLYKQEIDR